MQTEQEMRDSAVPTPKSSGDLVKYINELVNRGLHQSALLLVDTVLGRKNDER